MIITGPRSDDLIYDVCVIGSGPVGIALALECERQGLSVVVLEAGGEKESWLRRNRAEICSPNSHAPIHQTTCSAFGGTSWAWSGNCARFDEIDFQVREHVPFSGWPIGHADVEPWYAKAEGILNCQPDEDLPSKEGWGGLESVSVDSVLLSSAQPKLGVSHWQHFQQSKAITLYLNSPVIGLEIGGNGAVDSVTVGAPGRNQSIRARHVALAAGGLRSTQILLSMQRRWPNHFGSENGPLGRFYMGHLTGQIAAIKFKDRADVEGFTPQAPDGNNVSYRRFTINGAKQLSERLLNIAFWPAAPAFYDPGHSDPILSLAFLVGAIPMLGGLLIAIPSRDAHLGPMPRDYVGHCLNVLKGPAKAIHGAAHAVGSKIKRNASIGMLARLKNKGVFSLQYHAESEPNPESRVMLGEKLDWMGLPELRINLLFGAKDATSVVRAHDVLDGDLRRMGRACLEYFAPPEARAAQVLNQATDGYHQIGTTRMGADPKQSVVDGNCRVHGIENLFVVSSSVFPTGGHANPTLLAAALAVRLANRLGDLRRREASL